MIMLAAEHMSALPRYFKDITDPRRAEGTRHPLPVVLAIAIAATLCVQNRGAPDHVDLTPPDHGRIETRSIWCSTHFNDFLDFHHVGQIFMIEREIIQKKTGVVTLETVFGVTSCSPPLTTANAKHVLAVNRGHWAIENSCHYIIDWNFNEDGSLIRTGHGLANVTRLRRFAIGINKFFSDGKTSVAEKMRELGRNTRLVFDYLHLTKNSTRACAGG